MVDDAIDSRIGFDHAGSLITPVGGGTRGRGAGAEATPFFGGGEEGNPETRLVALATGLVFAGAAPFDFPTAFFEGGAADFGGATFFAGVGAFFVATAFAGGFFPTTFVAFFDCALFAIGRFTISRMVNASADPVPGKIEESGWVDV